MHWSDQMRVLSFDELLPKKGIRYSRSHTYRLIKNGNFPRPVAIGGNCVGFIEDEIDEWLASKVAERDAQLEDA
jgi:prophage regulatory protein